MFDFEAQVEVFEGKKAEELSILAFERAEKALIVSFFPPFLEKLLRTVEVRQKKGFFTFFTPQPQFYSFKKVHFSKISFIFLP